MSRKLFTILTSLIVALGGFLLGFDSAVISGAIPFYRSTFGLDSGSWLLGFSVSSIILGAIVGNLMAGKLADRFGRKRVLIFTAALFTISAIITAMAMNIETFIIARIIGGIGVGMAILVAPMYIAEIAPRNLRGTLVTFNQLNIVLGISVAYFSNYYIQQVILESDLKWRVMLGVEAVPALLYFFLLLLVPFSPRWLAQKGRKEEARTVLDRVHGATQAEVEIEEIEQSIARDQNKEHARWREVFTKKMRVVLIIGFGLGFFQQITGINAIFYYAPMIFEMTGGGTDTSFIQAAILGVTNVVMTVVAIFLIDRLGRKPLLYIGAAGIAISLSIVGFSFQNARYNLSPENFVELKQEVQMTLDGEEHLQHIANLSAIEGKEFTKEVDFFREVKSSVGQKTYNVFKEVILKHSITINPVFVLLGLILFVASFAISFGPVMWALFSEIFPNRLRALAISIVGFWNSVVSFSVTTVFPAQLEFLGSGTTYFTYAFFGLLAFFFVHYYVPETKGKSLEELQKQLVSDRI